MTHRHSLPQLPDRAPAAPRRRRLLLAGAAAALLSACGGAPLAPQPVARGDVEAVQQQLRTFIAHEMRQTRMAGLSVALVDDQQVLAAFGAGWADVAAQRPACVQAQRRRETGCNASSDPA